MRELTTIVSGMSFTECPRWHEGRIWFSDFYTNRVLSAAADGSDLRTELDVPNQPGGLGWLPDGQLLVVSARDHTLLRREHDGRVVVHANLKDHVGGNLNDMVVDAAGRAYVGNFGFDLGAGADPAPTTLTRVDPDGTVSVAAEGLHFPNGSVVTDDNVLIVDETFANRVTAFDIDDSGQLQNRRVWAQFGEVPVGPDFGTMLSQVKVAPDGCCLDAEGALWIADALSGKVIRVKEGGNVVDEIQVDSGVFACMLGGDDGRTLFLCAAPDFDPTARAATHESRLLTVRVDVPHGGRP
ncbi:SMP-30/gluconolactonase/LRE family protein [Pseudonocardia kujensis]|uniref:SMP-30/gluconolactonase/LRE family protein n=1 Tax=Pseudonocardia kujensis TaxID=1128675 RepID=UPI001E636678|nr:SMP-30/gluconolactonase/LRE family protein [Pseudonocardia kujensis]MCE0764559.1 SMP-30/gluconolactonase/LRE family protein [Pseudonocardia kujensis]